jgi:hypothetical protein
MCLFQEHVTGDREFVSVPGLGVCEVNLTKNSSKRVPYRGQRESSGREALNSTSPRPGESGVDLAVTQLPVAVREGRSVRWLELRPFTYIHLLSTIHLATHKHLLLHQC